MENSQVITPLQSFESRTKDTKSPVIKPQFDTDNLNINKLTTEVKQLSKANDFPVADLPKPLQEIIQATNESLNFPIDFIACSLLHAASTAIGNTHVSKWKWKENGCLYMAIVGNPGTIKTHPITFAYAPITERDKEYYASYKEDLKEYEVKQAEYLKNKKDGWELPKKPFLKKHIISDCTIEALAKVLQNNPRGICSHNDELAGWVGDMNKYSGGNSDVQKWLSMWSNQPIVVDRSSAPSIRIERPFVNVIGTIQPAVIDDLARDNKSKNGFLDRILFVKPKGLKRQGWNTRELDGSIRASWFLIMKKLLDLDFGRDTDLNEVSNALWFTKEAEEVLLQWQQENIDEDSELGSDTRDGISAKIEIYVFRFSLIIQLLKYACGESGKDRIEADTLRNAINIAKYFKTAALDIADYINSKSPIDRLPEIKQTIYRQLPKEFKTADAKGIVETVNSTFPEKNRIGERAFEYWLNEKTLFKKVSHGHYHKLYE